MFVKKTSTLTHLIHISCKKPLFSIMRPSQGKWRCFSSYIMAMAQWFTHTAVAGLGHCWDPEFTYSRGDNWPKPGHSWTLVSSSSLGVWPCCICSMIRQAEVAISDPRYGEFNIVSLLNFYPFGCKEFLMKRYRLWTTGSFVCLYLTVTKNSNAAILPCLKVLMTRYLLT